MKKITLLMAVLMTASVAMAEMIAKELFTVTTNQTYGGAEVAATVYRDCALHNDTLYVLTNAISGVQRIMLFNAQNGTYLKDLSVTGVSGGAIAMGDIEVLEDGTVMAMNCQTNCTTGDVKAYYWADANADPVNFMTTKLADALRVDCFHFEGTLASGALWTTYSDGTAGTTAKAIKIPITDTIVGTPIYYVLNTYPPETSAKVVSASDTEIAIATKGKMYTWTIADDGTTTIKWYTELGNKRYTNAVKTFEYDGQKYYATVNYANTNATISAASIAIYSYTTFGRWSTTGQTLVFSVPAAGLGDGRNTSFYNGLDVKVNEYGFDVYMTCLQEGMTAYKFYTPETKRIYCKMEYDWWKAENAAVGAYVWDAGGTPLTAWPGDRMTAVSEATDTWYVDVDIALYPNIIFTRMNPTDDGGQDWGAKTEDLTIPTDGKNLFTITSSSAVWGDPGCTGTWSTYSPGAGTSLPETSVLAVRVQNHEIVVPATVGSLVEIYNVMGQKVYGRRAVSSETAVSLPQGQIYIVRANGQVVKVRL